MHLGCQTIAFGPERLQNDLVGVLDKIAAIGYEGIEIGARFLDLDSPGAFAKLLQERSLALAGLHHGANLYAPQNLQDLVAHFGRIASFGKSIGCRNVIVSGASKEGGLGPEEIASQARSLNIIGRACAESGAMALYHNHAWEFMNDGAVIKEICRLTDPEFVGFAVDLGWANYAGSDPSKVLLDHRDRVKHVHVRDQKGKYFVELGHGDIDNEHIVETLREIGFDGWVVVEMELHAPHYGGRLEPAESVAIGFGYMRALFAVAGPGRGVA
ncbi:MAG: sugar phosphate isomerase/epimerase [Firmicutes bacterium]|nr:sugar phosphate isomerase/epimerase [Bacillota bacterium]